MSSSAFIALRIAKTLNSFPRLTTSVLAKPKVFYGKIVGTEFNVIEVRGNDERISWFWIGYKIHFNYRIPF